MLTRPSILLALGLPSAALANENIEFSIGGEDTAGNKLDVDCKGDLDELDGEIKLSCKDEDDVIVECASAEFNRGECDILIFGAGGEAVCIFVGEPHPTMTAFGGAFGDFDDPDDPPCQFGGDGSTDDTKETDVSIKIK